MEKKNLDDMKPEQLDTLREIGNIGSGNAVTALSDLLGREINMCVPQAQVVSFTEIMNILDGPEAPVAGMLVDISGALKGYILLVLDIVNAREMVSIALNEDKDLSEDISEADFNDMEMSALTEIANILIGSYLSSIISLTGLEIVPSVPHIAIDMLGAIISIAVVEYGQIGDSVLFLNTKFTDADKKELSGNFFLIPDYDSYKILVKSLGMEP